MDDIIASYRNLIYYHTLCLYDCTCQQLGQAELVALFKSNDAALVMAADRQHITCNLILDYGWLETPRA